MQNKWRAWRGRRRQAENKGLCAQKRTVVTNQDRGGLLVGGQAANPRHLTLYSRRHVCYSVGVAREDTALLASNRSACGEQISQRQNGRLIGNLRFCHTARFARTVSTSAMPYGMGEGFRTLAFFCHAGGLKAQNALWADEAGVVLSVRKAIRLKMIGC